LWLLCSFQGPPEANARRVGDSLAQARSHPAGAGLSKLNSMPATPRRAQEWTRRQAQGRPGSVDVLGPLVAPAARNGSLAPAGRR
jgi:hypothetical protein